jgi:copper transport protein
MNRPGLSVVCACVAALVLPATAQAHAVLLRASPSPSGTVDTAPRQVALTYTEAVEPRFAIVSVTDASGNQQTAGAPHQSATNADQLVVPLRRVGRGWYLVYWRVISVDGHPVRGAFTFAVGPNPGPAPQFAIPSLSETAATPRLVIARWTVFLSVMAAIGLLVLRLAVARPVVTRVAGTNLRHVTIAFGVASLVALIAIPVYVLLSTAQFALRSFWDWGALLPLMHKSEFGRGFLDLELVFAFFVAAGGVSIGLDRAETVRRSVAQLLALIGATAAAGAVLLVPGAAGHAAQTSPRGLTILFDWLHLVAGSVWVGGLIGLLVLWRSLPAAQRVAGLVVSVPRFSNTAFASVLVLIGAGIGESLIHFPTFASLWQTSYGQALLVKIALLATALVLGAANLLRTKPRLAANARSPDLGPGAASLLRRLVAGETLLVAGAVLAAAVLSSLAPPAKALASAGGAVGRVGPGAVSRTIEQNGYRLQLRLAPNRAAVPNRFQLAITRGGRPVRGADVTLGLAMLDMEMGNQAYRLPEVEPGVYSRSEPGLVMVGHWGVSFEIRPPGGQGFTVTFVDRAGG